MTNEQRIEVIDRLAHEKYEATISLTVIRYTYDQWKRYTIESVKKSARKLFEHLTDEQLTALILAGKDAE